MEVVFTTMQILSEITRLIDRWNSQMSVLYVFLLFSQIYKGRPAFVRSCTIHILVRNLHSCGIIVSMIYFVCDKTYPLSITCPWRPLIDLDEGTAYSVCYNVHIFFRKSLRLWIENIIAKLHVVRKGDSSTWLF